MAIRGRKPKATHLKIIEGNPGKRPLPTAEPSSDGSPAPPKRLRKRERELWGQFIATAWWLTEHDSAKAHMWVALHAEFEKSPANMTAARIGQLRAVGSELGLDPAARARLGSSGGKKPKQGDEEDPAAQYF